MNKGASGKPDRATHEQSPQAVSAVPVGIPSADVRWALSRARIRSYSHKRRDLSLEFDRNDDLTTVVTRVGMHPERQAEADGYDAACAAIAVAFFGTTARKAFELLEMVANEGGLMAAEDERLNRFCDDMAGGYDTINYCFDAGYLDQRGSEDNFTTYLLDAGRQVLALAQAIEARRAETGTGSVHESAVGAADAPDNPNP